MIDGTGIEVSPKLVSLGSGFVDGSSSSVTIIGTGMGIGLGSGVEVRVMVGLDSFELSSSLSSSIPTMFSTGTLGVIVISGAEEIDIPGGSVGGVDGLIGFVNVG